MTTKRTKLAAPWVRIVRDTTGVDYPSAAAGDSDGVIRSPVDVYRLLESRLGSEEQEVVVVLVLNARNRVVAVQEVTRGIVNSSLAHPREVFRLAIAYGAAAIIVAHNHPSEDPTPSADDRALTRQLVDAGRILDIPVVDHVIVGGKRFFSFSEGGLL